MFRIRPWGRVFLRFRLLYGNTVKMHVWVCVYVVVSVIRQIFTTGLPEYAENVNNTEFRCVFVSFPILVGRRKPRFYRFFPVEMFLQKNCNSITKFNGLAAAAQWAIFSRLFFYQIRISYVKYGPFFLEMKWMELLSGEHLKHWIVEEELSIQIGDLEHSVGIECFISILFHISQDASGRAIYSKP